MTNDAPKLSEVSKLPDDAKVALARAAEKGVDHFADLTDRFGSFLYRVIGGPVEDAVSIGWDWIKLKKLENGVRLAARVEQIHAQRQADIRVEPLPLSFAMPLIEAASIEEDGALSEIYARLLANALDKNAEITADATMVSIARSLRPMDALILDRVCAQIDQTGYDEYRLYKACKLPEVVEDRNENQGEYGKVDPEVEIALWNLRRLSCIGGSMYFGGGEGIGLFNVTLLGYRFYRSCKI